MTTCELSFGACAPVFELLCFLCFPPSHAINTVPPPYPTTSPTSSYLSQSCSFRPKCCPFLIAALLNSNFLGLQGPGEMIFSFKKFPLFLSPLWFCGISEHLLVIITAMATPLGRTVACVYSIMSVQGNESLIALEKENELNVLREEEAQRTGRKRMRYIGSLKA